MRKGFTLIELLAVVVILAIVLAIAIPGVSQIIDSTKYSTFNDDEQLLIRSTKNYISFGNANEPQNIGDTVEITLSQLKSAGLISDIVSPWDKNTNCNGYVLITKTDSNKYNYEPYLNCVNNIGSKADNGLVAHWTFDDYEEPTQNLISNNSFESNNTSGWAIANAASGTFTIDNTVSLFGTKSLKINVSNGGDQHQNTSYNFGTSIAGRTFTVSAWVKTENINTGVSCSIYWINSSGSWVWSNIVRSSYVKGTSDWTRISATGVAPADAYQATILLSPSYPADGQGSYWIDGVQIEEKNHPTPYVDGTRGGTVRDYSGNGNNGTLQLSTTPKWVNDAKVGEGAYQFDGIDDYISVTHNASLMPSSITLTGWIKFDDSENGSWMMIDKSSGGASGAYYIYGDSLSYNYRSLAIFSPSGSRYDAPLNTTFEKNKWYHLVGTFDANTGIMKSYVNGELKSTYTGATLGSNSENILIGRYITGYYTAGEIDDIRIYNRALTTNEIKNMYDIENNR